jgi:hypothetical protein
MATVLSSFEQPLKAAVFLAPILDIRQALARFAVRAQLAPWTRRSLKRRVRRFGAERWPELTIGAEADIPNASMLVMHDSEDPEAPFTTSEALAERRPDTRLIELRGLGHYRLLNDPTVVDSVAEFLSYVLTVTTRTPVSATG